MLSTLEANDVAAFDVTHNERRCFRHDYVFEIDLSAYVGTRQGSYSI